MRHNRAGWFGCVSILALMVGMAGVPDVAAAQEGTDDAIRQQIESLERQLEALKERLDMAEERAEAAEEKADAAGEAAQEASAAARQATDAGAVLDKATSKWHLAGYADASFVASDTEETDSFGIGHFNPGFHFQFNDWVFFESELEFEIEDGQTEVELEYSQIDLLLHDSIVLVVGKWLSPVGQFQERLHPTWINKMPDAPAGFGHGGVQPLSDVGVQLRGRVPLGGPAVTYAVAIGNGPQGGHHGPELEGFVEDNNDNKAVSGRVGILPVPYLEVGASFMSAKVLGEEAPSGPVTNGDFTLWGFDAAFTKGAWDIRGEYLDSELDNFFGRADHEDETTSLIPGTDWKAWYVQGAYRLSGLTDQKIVRNFEPVVRYGEFKTEGFFHGESEDRFNVGVNYWFASSAVVKVGAEWRDFEEEDEENETRFQVQFAYGF